MPRSLCLAVAFLLWLTPGPGYAAQEVSWVGRKIMTRQAGTKITGTDDQQKQTVTAELKFTDYTVLADQGGRLKVMHQGVAGWFDKRDAVLLAEAVSYFGDRIKSNPKDDEAFQRRGLARLLQGEHNAALQDISAAIRLNPKAAPWWNSRANVHRLRKDFVRAFADYDEAIRLDNAYAEAFNNRGVAHRANKDYARALADFQEAIRLDPQDALGFNSAAWLQAVCPDEKYRNGKKAVELATKACELTHWKRQGYIDTLAAAYAETGKFEEAVKYQQRALADPGYQQRHGAWARKVLALYQDKKPYRED